jgi:hypothetical protein
VRSGGRDGDTVHTKWIRRSHTESEGSHECYSVMLFVFVHRLVYWNSIASTLKLGDCTVKCGFFSCIEFNVTFEKVPVHG